MMALATALTAPERHAYAGRLARRHLSRLLADAEQYPASYDRERIMREADAILDDALDLASKAKLVKPVACVVCDDEGCEFCPKVA